MRGDASPGARGTIAPSVSSTVLLFCISWRGCPIRRRIIPLLSVPLDSERGPEALRPLQPRSIASTLRSGNSRRVSADRPRKQSLACPSRHKAVRARPAGHDGATAWTTTLPTAPPTRSHSFLTAVVPGIRRAKTIGPPPHRLIEAAAHMLAVCLKCLRAGLRQGDKGAVVSESAKGASVLHHLQAWRTREPGPPAPSPT